MNAAATASPNQYPAIAFAFFCGGPLLSFMGRDTTSITDTSDTVVPVSYRRGYWLLRSVTRVPLVLVAIALLLAACDAVLIHAVGGVVRSADMSKPEFSAKRHWLRASERAEPVSLRLLEGDFAVPLSCGNIW